MRANPLFSIIIPVYKSEKFIEKCVYSILKQDFRDFEIIIVDDGSPDRCPQICDALAEKDNRIQVIHKTNGGVSAARKDGAMRAKGDYIICVDGDDWLSDDCLAKIASAIETTDADIVCHGMFRCGSDGQYAALTFDQEQGYYAKADIERKIFPALIQKNDASYFIPSLCGKAIRKKLFLDNLLSDRRATIGEDGACVIPCVFHARSLFIIKQCLYYYRYNDTSATKSRKVFNWDWVQVVNDHISDKIDLDYADFREQMNRKIAHDIFTVAVTQFYRNEPYRKVAKEIKLRLENERFDTAIAECRFARSFVGTIMKFTLKNRVLFPIYIYSKWKK